MTVTRAILIAAGRGKRLGAHTDAGIEELVVIRGYRGDVLTADVRGRVARAQFVDNLAWQTNNVLLSLACARPFLDRPCLISYSDIIFTPEVACAAARSTAELALVIDREFRSIYEGRSEHPLDEGEVADLMPDGSVARVGKRALPPAEAIGEFIGLAKLGERGVATVGHALDSLARRYADREDEPFQRAARYRNAYLTDLWQELIDGGIRVDPVLIDGGWREIDTGQDLDRARSLVDSGRKEWS
jgi:L-glutamine-phosphate cytidylyltransferase